MSAHAPACKAFRYPGIGECTCGAIKTRPQADEDATTDQMKLTAEPERPRADPHVEILERLAQFATYRHAADACLAGARAIGQVAALQAERTRYENAQCITCETHLDVDLAERVQALTAERDDARTREQVCFDLHDALSVKWGHDPYARIAALQAAEAALTALQAQLTPLLIEMDAYAQHETLYRDAAVGRTISGWAERLRQLFPSTDAVSSEDRSDWRRRATAAEAALRDLQQAAGALSTKLDQILPKVDSIIALQTVRAGRQAYDGPSLIEELATLRQLLPLTDADPPERL